MPTKTSFTYKLSPKQQADLKHILMNGNYLPVSVPHTSIAVEKGKCRINLYKSGKCLVQGKEASDFVTFILEPMVLQSVELGYEDVLHPELSQPHMGVDESGKGDFFGPMVIACAFVDPSLISTMREMDVKDSKNISSDKKALGMGKELRKLLGNRYSVVTIGPAAYNRLYSKMRTVNTLLAWGHARAIENLLENVPDCPRAISDQFGNEKQVLNALMKKGRNITLEQRHKAESDIAVAAASILAREGFLLALKNLETKYNIPFPKGASQAVKDAAVDFIKQEGPERLLGVAKCHFRTTDAVLETAGHTRKVLGPEGQARSRQVDPERFRRKSS